ncbi:MAG: tRNA threonylcarbamoyladenosine dehydratase [Oscillospiraceae bacterium]
MDEQFLRTEMLLGPRAMEILAKSHVAVFGLGGVGSWCCEALARSGIGELTVIDSDAVSPSNLNRQVEATYATIGQEKAVAMAERIACLSKDCKVHPLVSRYEGENRETFFGTHYDYIVDAIDLVSCKLDLIQTALERGIPIISALGTGNKLDPSQFSVTDISKTEGCPLARIIRKELRVRGILHHKVVFSPELSQPLFAPTAGCEAPPPGRRTIPASAPWVPPVAGFLLAGAVVQDLIK